MKSPFVPMSSMTGRPTRAIIFDYLKKLKENSIDCIMAYPRSGCELEYLSDEWFETVGNYIECAKELDMSVWLYDDFNWPSGRAGGRVTKNESLCLKSFIYKGENIGKIEISSQDVSEFDEYSFPDLLSHEAVDLFIKTTHEEYYKRFGEYFGNVIVGFFTDEPAMSYGCRENSLPYYNGIEDDYRTAFSRSFENDLKSGYEYFKRNVMSLAGDRFSECYTKKIADWCDRHGVLFTGHLMHDDAPHLAAALSGKFLKNLSNFTVPGIDNIWTNLDSGDLPILLGAAEYAAGENGAMAELFALGPCDMPYTVKRAMIFFASCFKIRHYVLAVSHLDMRGNAKIASYFHDFSPTAPDFCAMKLLAEDAKLASEIAKKDFTPDVFVRYPSTVCMDKFGDEMDVTPFRDIINALSLHQIGWKYLDEGECAEGARVIEFEDGFSTYVLGDLKTKDALQIVKALSVKITVTDENAASPEGIFVRRYDDGTVLILNRTRDEKTVYYNGESIHLYGYGVFISDRKHEATECGARTRIYGGFDIEYENENVARCMYVNDATEFEVNLEEALDVRFAVRNGCKASVGECGVDVYDTNGCLPNGLNAVYKISKPLTISKGKTEIRSENDIKYLPSVLIFGDFSYRISSGDICSVTLSERARSYKQGERLADFGKVAFKKTAVIPENAKYLELSNTELYTEVFVNGELIGKRICAPYVFDVEKYACQSVELKIVQYSTLSSLFGDVEYFNEHHKNIMWRNTPSPKPCEFGFEAGFALK